MNDTSNHEGKCSSHESWICSRTGIATMIALSILGFLVYTGHSAHLLGLVPYLFLLACPLMHIFMHGGHHHGSHTDDKDERGGGGCGGSSHQKKHQHTDESSSSTQGDA